MLLKELANAVGLPESTVRLYRDEFAEYLPVLGEGRRRRYPPEALLLMRQIIAWKREGQNVSQIRDELNRQRQPGETSRRRTSEERWDEVTARLTAQASEVTALRIEVAALRGDLAKLTALLKADRPVTMDAVQEALLRETR